jgi:hypothetical protein
MSTTKNGGFGRREFLKVSTCALAAVTVAPQTFAGLVAQPKVMVAGYSPLDIESADVSIIGSNITDAARASADRAFLRLDARVSAFGLSGGNRWDLRARDLTTHYAIGRGRERQLVPFHTWISSGRPDDARPVSFIVPIDEEQRINFTVSAMTRRDQSSSGRGAGSGSSAPEPTAIPVGLSLGGERDTFPLSRGFYIIVPVYDGQTPPSWDSYMLRRTSGGWALFELGGADARPAAFEHFVVRVDYARQEPNVE